MKQKACAVLALALAGVAVPGATSAQAVAERDMPAHCRGEASAQFGANPRYIESGDVERAKHGFRVVGSYEASDGSRAGFRCRFNGAGEFRGVVALDHGGNRPSQRQVSACNDMMLGTGKIVETTPLMPGAFELILDFPDGNFVCDVEANGSITYFEKLR